MTLVVRSRATRDIPAKTELAKPIGDFLADGYKTLVSGYLLICDVTSLSVVIFSAVEASSM